MRVPFECPSLDQLLGGGIESGIITEIYGEGGSGKTNICLQISRNCARRSKVVYIDTEGISVERFRQICDRDFDSLSKNVLFCRAYTSEEQTKAINDAIKMANNGIAHLIVWDSAIIHYRLGGEDEERNLLLNLRRLMGIALEKDIPVLITNQVYTDAAAGILRPICEYSIGYLAKAIISLQKNQNSIRTATIIKHRSRPEGISAEFRITERGVE